jgi:hypothetical protein
VLLFFHAASRLLYIHKVVQFVDQVFTGLNHHSKQDEAYYTGLVMVEAESLVDVPTSSHDI